MVVNCRIFASDFMFHLIPFFKYVTKIQYILLDQRNNIVKLLGLKNLLIKSLIISYHN